jgi:hypothetical protein
MLAMLLYKLFTKLTKLYTDRLDKVHLELNNEHEGLNKGYSHSMCFLCKCTQHRKVIRTFWLLVLF